MFLTKKHLSRRTVLKGAGVTIALPLLDAMIPAATALAQTAAAPKLRAGFFYLPHGAIMWNTTHGAKMDHWMPSGAGDTFKLSPILEPLESYKRYVTTFDRIEAEGAARQRPRVHAGHLVERRASRRGSHWRIDGADDRPIDRRAYRSGHRAALARGGRRDDGAERLVR